MRNNKVIRWIITILLSIAFIAPICYIVGLSINSNENIWPHLLNTLLPSFIKNSFILMLGTGGLALLFGLVSAWSITFYDFPSRNFLMWGLLLPFSVPSYMIAYIYTDLLDYSGPVQIGLRNFFDWSSKADYWFPEIRSLSGAIFLFALVLYPYIYLLARKAFLEQSVSVRQSAQVLGCGRWKMFFHVSFPLARPAITVGLFLVMMETLSDFGTVEYFSLNTLSLGAYNVWVNMGNVGAAAQIALLTLAVIFLMIFLEKFQRLRRRQVENSDHFRARKKIRGWKKFFFLVFNWSLIIFGFLIPFITLFRYTLLGLLEDDYFKISALEFIELSKNSLFISLLTALLTVMGSFILVRYLIDKKGILMKWFLLFFSMGYALPGTILGIGVLASVAGVNTLWESGRILGGTLTLVLYAYLIRFLTIPIGAIDSGYDKISDNIHSAARLLSRDRWQPIFEIDLPLIKKSLLTGFLIVFVDVMKELPLMLILRPMNYETLATQVYNFASDESIEKACLSALTIVLVGIIPVIILTKSIDHAKVERIV